MKPWGHKREVEEPGAVLTDDAPQPSSDREAPAEPEPTAQLPAAGPPGPEPTAELPTVTSPPNGTAVRPDGPQAPRQWIAPGEPIISIRGVTKSFGSHVVLQDVTFDIPKGRTTAILGPSGTGKSVLLKNILGLLQPDRGEIWVDGDQIVGMREKRLYEVRKKFGVLFQDGALFGSMSLYDNIAFPLREHTRKNEREIREIVLRNAELVGLLDHLKKLPGEVSGGMKKRAGLARAMVTEPDIVLFDEPDSGLDPVRVAYLDDLVNTAQHETGATFFVITHNITSVRRIADYMGVLYRSRLVKFGPQEELLATDDPVIQQFLSGRSEGPIGMDEMADNTEPAGRRREAESQVESVGRVVDRSHPEQSDQPEGAGASAAAGAPGATSRTPKRPIIIPVPKPADEPDGSPAPPGTAPEASDAGKNGNGYNTSGRSLWDGGLRSQSS